MATDTSGGDLQIGARLAVGEVDCGTFVRDHMTAQPHEPDINALVQACDVHDVPCATNVATARVVVKRCSHGLRTECPVSMIHALSKRGVRPSAFRNCATDGVTARSRQDACCHACNA